MSKSKTALILFIACAVIWTIRLVTGIVSGTYDDASTVFVLDVVCDVLWIIAAYLQFRRYRKR